MIEIIEATKLQRIKFYLAVRAKKKNTHSDSESLTDFEDGVNETVVASDNIMTDFADNETKSIDNSLSAESQNDVHELDINLNVAVCTMKILNLYNACLKKLSCSAFCQVS